jgi:hypothetical protein
MESSSELDATMVTGNWEGTGYEVYCEVNETNTQTLGFNIKMTVKKVDDDVYRIKSKYYYSEKGEIFGISHTKGDLAGTDNFLFSVHHNGLYASGLWNEKDRSSRTVERISFKGDDLSTMYYNYNANEIVNPLNAYFKRVSTSVQRVFNRQSGKISVAGHFVLKKKN